ncbi:calcium-independent phospholipase A2 [Fusarium napiforme]|uniref:Calcium-independent phospholipase A2 n=1 Tax=Fusarium napiforme TaxID=42672 RepID=A0A8H5JMZ2_9HYPO|nr:calcium-independent phospholipase A2 [Fusarium napiforme]
MKELDPALYNIVWIAPLEIEAQAALHMLDNLHDGRFPVNRGDDYIFSAGDINGHNIIIATLPAGQEYGTGSAAALASQIKMFFTNLWCGLLVGVAAGLPDLRKTPPIDIRLGDVLVGLSEGDSAGLVAYDLGKETSEGFQLLRSGRVLANTETVIRSAIGNIKLKAPDDTDAFLPFYENIKDLEHSKGTFEDPGQEKDIFYDIGDDGVDSPVQRMQRPTDRRTRVWYGSIGSGDKLTRNTRKRNEIRDRYGVIGLEMEAAGTMNRIPVGVIRGVCDYADEHKNKEWQPYAAAMAAAYAKAVIYELGPGKVMPSSSMTNEGKHALCGTILSDLPPTTDRFFGRESELLEMIACLESTNQRKGVVLCGISGSGKTQLAREYVAQRRENYSAILWIDASSEESIEESFSDCSSRICQHNPEYRVGRESTPPRQLVLEWLRTTPDKNWLTVIDNVNGPIPNKRLLGPFMDMSHGSLCVISTNQVTTRPLGFKQTLVEHLDTQASQSLLLWRAYESDITYESDGMFTLFLLPCVLHQRGIIHLNEFAANFNNDYPELAQFEIDSGVWVWTRDGANESLFSMLNSLYASVSMKSKESALLISLCSIYGPSAIPISLVSNLELIGVEDTADRGPWKQLQLLVQSKIKLKKAIDELSKIFLATKKQANDRTLLSFSVHASICQWRLTTMDDRDTWIIQATYSLSKHILSLKDKSQVVRFYNLFNRCLELLWQHIDTQHIDVYLSMGKSEIAIKLFTSAIDHIRSSGPGHLDENILLQLLCGLARSCENRREFELAEEALSSAATLSERLNGHMNDLTVSLVSQLKAVRTHMLTQLENRKRALVASTGPKLASRMDSSAGSLLETKYEEISRQPRKETPEIGGHDSSTNASSSGPRAVNDLTFAWELRFSDPVLVFSLQDDEDPFSGLSDAFPMTIQGRLNIMTFKPLEITSVYIEINASGMDANDRNQKQRDGYGGYFQCWRLRLFDAHATSNAKFGNCIFILDDGDSQENAIQTENDVIAMTEHVSFPPGFYSYSFEMPVDCLYAHAENSINRHIDWTVFACMRLSEYDDRFQLRKELPVIQIPHQMRTKRIATGQLTRQQREGMSFSVDLPYRIWPVGGKIPITVTLGPANNGFRAEYLSYTIVERGETDQESSLLLQRFSFEKSASAGNDNSTEQDGEGTTLSSEIDEYFKASFKKRYLPDLDDGGTVSLSEDLMLPTCKQIDAGLPAGQTPNKRPLVGSTSHVRINSFIQVALGGLRPDRNEPQSQTQFEAIEEIPIEIVYCRINLRNDLLVDSMAPQPMSTNNTRSLCGCPDADSEPLVEISHDGTLEAIGSRFIRAVNGESESQTRRRNAKFEELWDQPIQGPSKSQHWEDVYGTAGNLVHLQDSELRTAKNASQSYGFTSNNRGDPPPYSE